jgi:transposase InsO family protein
MDFTHPPRLIDGVFSAILNVVDLGSRQQLCWLPVLHEDLAVVQDVLRDLFEEHGAPLIIKSDNGPAFRAEAIKKVLSDWRVFPLFSPPYCASYNGVCERANQTMKLMTADVAECAGRGR